MPGIGAILRIVQQSFKKRWLHAFEVTLCLANDVARHELGRVLKHMDKAVQLAQDVVRNMAAGLGLAIDINRHVQVLAAHFFNKVAQIQHRRVQIRSRGEFFVVNRQNECAGTALLLGKLAQVAIAGDAQHLKALGLDRLGQGPDAQARGVLRAKVFIDDDDGKAKLHYRAPAQAISQKEAQV